MSEAKGKIIYELRVEFIICWKLHEKGLKTGDQAHK